LWNYLLGKEGDLIIIVELITVLLHLSQFDYSFQEYEYYKQ